jgi:hypothetical protein
MENIYAEEGLEKMRALYGFLPLSRTALESSLERPVGRMRTRTQKENCHLTATALFRFFFFYFDIGTIPTTVQVA